MIRKTSQGNVREIVTMKEARKSKKKRVTVARGIQYDTVTKHFLVEFNHGKVDGRIKRVRKTFPTLEEAKEASARFEVEKLNGLPENISKKITFGECIEEFITARQIEETTKRGYIVIENRIRKTPLYGKLLKDVTENDIEDYMKSMQGQFKNVTINKDYTLIHSVLKFAVKRRYIASNRADFVEKLKEENFQSRWVDLSEYPTFFERVTATGDITLIIAAYLGLCQGLRRGEMCGLKWEKIDFENNTILIDNTITTVGGKIIEKKPKTEQSKATITMNDKVKELLLEIRKEETKSGQISEYVIHNQKGGFFNPTFLSKKFKAFVDKNGFTGVRLHDERHSYATAAMKAGASLYDVSAAVRHSTVGITAGIYIHSKALDGSKAVNNLLKF